MDATIQRHSITSVVECFSDLEDPRVVGRTKHQLIDIIIIAICAVICGAKTFKGMEAFAYAKYKWLKKFLELPHGIPTHQTIGRVFSLIPAEEFLNCFMVWVQWSELKTAGEIVAIDGKMLRRSHYRRKGKLALYLVNAFATANGIAIGHEKTAEKSNEIKAIPPLLKKLDIAGCIVTLDAMGCQKGIANLIKLRGADYVLAVKSNQGRLFKKLNKTFEIANKNQFNAMVYKETKGVEKDHGRVEERIYTILPLMYFFSFKKVWKGLQTLIQVKSRTYCNGEEKILTRYYISSLPFDKCEKITQAIRQHWHVENRLHWCLDVVLREDDCRIRRGYADQNMATLRQLILNMLRRDKGFKAGLEIKQQYAAWNNHYLKQLIGF